MTTEETIRKAQGLTQSEAVAFAGKLIADAIDRYTEMQRKSIEAQMRLSGLSEEMLKSVMKKMREEDEGERWKINDND